MEEEQNTREADLVHIHNINEQDFFDSWAAYRQLVIKQLEYLENTVKEIEEKLEKFKNEYDELKISCTEMKTKMGALIWVGGTLVSLLTAYLSSYFSKLFGGG